jgi:hypothetical protein
MKRVFLLAVIMLSVITFSEINVEYSFAYGGEGDDVANDLVLLEDGSILIAGYTTSITGDFGPSNGEEDFLVVKMDGFFEVLWSRTFGGSDSDIAEAIVETRDGGFVVVGMTESSDGDVSMSNKLGDFWIIKLSSEGELLWEKTFGGSGQDHAYDVVERPSGNVVIAGYTRSVDGDVQGHVWGEDFWIIELASTGELLNQWTIDGENNNEDLARKLLITDTGEVLAVGYTAYKDVGISCNYVNEQAALAIIDNEGVVSSYKSYGGMYLEDGYDVMISEDTIIIVGEQDAGISMFSTGLGGKDFYVVAIDEKGQELWSENHGGTFTDIARVVKPFGASDLLVAGHTTSQDIDIEDPLGMTDGWIIVINENGELVESLSVGGSADDFILSGVSSDEKYIFCGYSTSSDGDLESNKGGKDIWLISLGK